MWYFSGGGFMGRIPVVITLIASLCIPFATGINSDIERDRFKKSLQSELEAEQAVDILKVAIWAMVTDGTGAAMRRLCNSQQRTPQGVATVMCKGGDSQVAISMDGRPYGSGVPVVMARFTMFYEGGIWKGPDPQDREQPKYRLYKHGPGLP
jgi:hypothetical protein